MSEMQAFGTNLVRALDEDERGWAVAPTPGGEQSNRLEDA